MTLLLVTPLLLACACLLASLPLRKRAGLLPALRASANSALLAAWIFLLCWIALRILTALWFEKGPVEWLGFQPPSSSSGSGQNPSVLRAAFPWLNFLLASMAAFLLCALSLLREQLSESRQRARSRNHRAHQANQAHQAHQNHRDPPERQRQWEHLGGGREAASGAQNGRRGGVPFTKQAGTRPASWQADGSQAPSGSPAAGAAAVLQARRIHDKPPYALPLSLIFVIAGVGIQAAFLWAPRKWEAAALPIDLAIVLPQMAWLLALQLHSRALPPFESRQHSPSKPRTEFPDLEPVLAQAGVIDPKNGVLFHFEEKAAGNSSSFRNGGHPAQTKQRPSSPSSPQHTTHSSLPDGQDITAGHGPSPDSSLPQVPPDNISDLIWQAAGGWGKAPQALLSLAQHTGPSDAAHLLGDLPASTEEVFRLSALASPLLQGQRVLVLGAAPEKERDGLRELLAMLEKWPAGPLVSGSAELKESLKKNLLPAAVFLNFSELGSSGVPLLLQPEARHYFDGLGLILLIRPDSQMPLAATHLHFALRRLHLPWAETRGAPALLATGNQSAASRRFIEDAIARPVQSLEPGLERSAALRVHLAKGRPTNPAEQDKWWATTTLAASQSLSELAAPNIRTQAEGPPGAWAGLEQALRRQGAQGAELGLSTVEPPGYSGECSLVLLDESQLAAMFRSARHLGTPVRAKAHVSLWFTPDSLFSRFLLQANRLSAQYSEGSLPSPRPLAGKLNRWIASAHLEAALREGEYSESALISAFGESVLSARLQRGDLANPGFTAAPGLQPGQIHRSPLLRASGKSASPPNNDTITLDTLAVKDSQSGRHLFSVDRRHAATRYYPQRIFEFEGKHYQVPANAWAQEADAAPLRQLQVHPAQEGALLNHPVLEIQLAEPRISAAPIRSTQNGRTIDLVQAEVEVYEQVRQAWHDSPGSDGLYFTPVHAQYPSRVMLLNFPRPASPNTFHHLARLLDAVLLGHLQAAPEDVEVIAVGPGFAGLESPGIAFVDRHLGGLGVAEALEPSTIHDLLRWSRSLIYHCSCIPGCDQCSPHDLPAHLRDKQGVLSLLSSANGSAVA